MSNRSHIAVVIGASRGLGLGLVRAYLAKGWHVIATMRSSAPSLSALAETKSGLRIEICDIDEQDQIDGLRARLSDTEIDVLFVNAGISNGPNEIVEDLSMRDLSKLLLTNALAPLKVIDAFDGLVRDGGAIAVMSSNLASVSNNTTGMWEGCRASKAALNMFMRSYVARHPDSRTYLAISPGWVKTDMGGQDAPLDVETSVKGILEVIQKRQGNSGLTFVNYLNEPVAW